MNKNLTKAMESAARVKTLLHSLELTVKDIDVEPEDIEAADMAVNLLYMAQELTEDLTKYLEDLSGDSRICDVLLLAHEVHFNQ